MGAAAASLMLLCGATWVVPPTAEAQPDAVLEGIVLPGFSQAVSCSGEICWLATSVQGQLGVAPIEGDDVGDLFMEPDPESGVTRQAQVISCSGSHCVIVGVDIEDDSGQQLRAYTVDVVDGEFGEDIYIPLPEGFRSWYPTDMECIDSHCVVLGVAHGEGYAWQVPAILEIVGGIAGPVTPVLPAEPHHTYVSSLFIDCPQAGVCLFASNIAGEGHGDVQLHRLTDGHISSQSLPWVDTIDALACDSIDSCIFVGEESTPGLGYGPRKVYRWDGMTLVEVYEFRNSGIWQLACSEGISICMGVGRTNLESYPSGFGTLALVGGVVAKSTTFGADMRTDGLGIDCSTSGFCVALQPGVTYIEGDDPFDPTGPLQTVVYPHIVPASVPDQFSPVITVSDPAEGAGLLVNEPVQVSYTCSDDASGVVTCFGLLDGWPIANGEAIPTHSPGPRSLTVSSTDHAGNTTVVTRTFEVLSESIMAEVVGGSVVRTGTSATPDAPVQTAVSVPMGVEGTITVRTDDLPHESPAGFELIGKSVTISGPPTTASAPYTMSFSVDHQAIEGSALEELVLLRNGEVVGDCTHHDDAEPDPCIADRSFLGAPEDDDAVVTVRTSKFSVWQFARAVETPPEPQGAVLKAEAVLTSTLKGLIPRLRLEVAAHLVDSEGNGLASQKVSFSAGGSHVCSSYTSADGTARCAYDLKSLASLLGGVRATFAGNDEYQPASGVAGLL